jgi:hypothetical protein
LRRTKAEVFATEEESDASSNATGLVSPSSENRCVRVAPALGYVILSVVLLVLQLQCGHLGWGGGGSKRAREFSLCVILFFIKKEMRKCRIPKTPLERFRWVARVSWWSGRLCLICRKISMRRTSSPPSPLTNYLQTPTEASLPTQTQHTHTHLLLSLLFSPLSTN